MAEDNERIEDRTINHLYLDRFKWKNRLLLLFAPAPDHQLYEQQQRYLADQEEGLDERDIVRFHIFADEESYLVEHPYDQQLVIEPGVAAEAREQLGVDEGQFALILISKDGVGQFRWTVPLTAEDLFKHIDGLPMRQEEMEQGKLER